MVGDVNLVSNLQRVSPIAIGLPNGDCTVARDVGLVNLGDEIKLDNVLYVPNLNCNLVSESKLYKQLNCAMTYLNDFCVIRDRTSRTLIGAGEQREGVYYYKRASSNQANAVKAKCLWHQRLGHPSREVLLYLPHSLGINCDLNKDKEEACEVCLRVKQTQNQFPISNSNVKDNFDFDSL